MAKSKLLKIATLFTGILVVLLISFPLFFAWYQADMLMEFKRAETTLPHAARMEYLDRFSQINNALPKYAFSLCEYALPILFSLFIVLLLMQKANFWQFTRNILLLLLPILLQVAVYSFIFPAACEASSQYQLLSLLFGFGERKIFIWLGTTLLLGFGVSLYHSYREKWAKAWDRTVI